MNRDLEAMKRGGKKKKAKRSKAKPSQQQIVNVKVRVGDTVQLYPDRMKPKEPPMVRFHPSYDPALEPRRLAGAGFMFANAPQASQAAGYAVPPSAVRPLSNRPLVASSDPSRNSNQDKADDLSQIVNPWGIKPGLEEVRAIKNEFESNFSSALPGVSSSSAFEGKQMGPGVNRGGEMRVISSGNLIQSMLPFSRPGGQPSGPGKQEAESNSAPMTPIRKELLHLIEQLPMPKRASSSIEALDYRLEELENAMSLYEIGVTFGVESHEEALIIVLQDEIDRKYGFKARGGVIQPDDRPVRPMNSVF